MTIDSQVGQPISALMTSARANRFTPAISTAASANVRALNRCVAGLKRRSRNSGTLRTRDTRRLARIRVAVNALTIVHAALPAVRLRI